jgi:hypothetical protein
MKARLELEMPDSCDSCRFYGWMNDDMACLAASRALDDEFVEEYFVETKRADFCPLMEVKEVCCKPTLEIVETPPEYEKVFMDNIENLLA